MIHPSSVLQHQPAWCIYHEFVLTSKHFIRTVTDVKPEWLFEVVPGFFNPDNFKDAETKRELMKIEREMVQRS